jgi:hypothetical protein
LTARPLRNANSSFAPTGSRAQPTGRTAIILCDDPSDGADEYTKKQLSRFAAALDFLSAHGEHLGLRQICNTAHPEIPEAPQRHGAAAFYSLGYNTAHALRPWRICPSRTEMPRECVREIAGECISYSRKFRATTDARGHRFPCLCRRYARAMSNKGRVILHGLWADVLGAVCKDIMMVCRHGYPRVQTAMLPTINGRRQPLRRRPTTFRRAQDTARMRFSPALVPRENLLQGEKTKSPSRWDCSCWAYSAKQSPWIPQFVD